MIDGDFSSVGGQWSERSHLNLSKRLQIRSRARASAPNTLRIWFACKRTLWRANQIRSDGLSDTAYSQCRERR